MCNATVSFPGCDVINFEINLIFLIKPFFYITKKSIQTFEYLENEKRFKPLNNGGTSNVSLLTKFCRLATVCGVIIYTKFQNN